MTVYNTYTLPFFRGKLFHIVASYHIILDEEPKVMEQLWPHSQARRLGASRPLRQLFAGTWLIDRFPDRAIYVAM